VREFWLLDDARTFGGGQRILLRLARFIEEAVPDRSAHVVCPETSELAERCHASGIAVSHATFPDLGVATGLRVLRAVRDLRRVLQGTSDTALVVASSLRTQVYAHAASARSRPGRPIVHLMPEQDSARRTTARLLLRRYGAVVVVGDNAARAYEHQIPGLRVRVVNNFLSPEELMDAPTSSRPPLGGRQPALGVLARLIPEKGVLELVNELGEGFGRWSTLVVGGDRQDERYAVTLESRIVELGLSDRVVMAGRVDDLASFFAGIDALVVPSIGNEGQPTVILEALAHGRPVIVREPIWSEALAGLPILTYRDGTGLRDALSELEPIAGVAGVSAQLATRFSPMHVLEAIEAAAEFDLR
jgi:glycosyltransferase involved in cell wall biosynthesis